MGCVLFETIVWLLYGPKGLGCFLNPTTGPTYTETLYYATYGTPTEAKVNDKFVGRWIDHMLKYDPECDPDKTPTALEDLLRLVKKHLLVVPVEGPSCRCDARKLNDELKKIIVRGKQNKMYLASGRDRAHISFPQDDGDMSSPSTLLAVPASNVPHAPKVFPRTVKVSTWIQY